MRKALRFASLPVMALIAAACARYRAAPLSDTSSTSTADPVPVVPAPAACAAPAATEAPAEAKDEGWGAPRGAPRPEIARTLAGKARAAAGAPATRSADAFGMGRGGGAMAYRVSPSPAFIADSPVRAGEWDDNANYRDFMRYLADEERVPYHRVDLTHRRFLVVRDADGRAVPRCSVTVTDTTEHAVTLTTTASGRAILFPHAEGLGATLSATASCEGQAATARFTTEADDDAVSLRLPGKRSLPAARLVDVAFILDTTGSMNEEIEAVKSTIAKVTRSLSSQNYQARMALVEYKDRGDEFVTRVHAFSTTPSAFLAGVAGVTASGGGDYPESVNQGLHDGLTKLDWGSDAVARFAFLIGDAPPHLDYANDTDYASDMKSAAHRGIQVFTVAASGMDDLGQAVWRQIAQYTGATNLFVLRGGAGPQSTGAGDPKSSCGGTQTQYASGNLDTLITRKILGELKGIDADAMRIAGLYKDESAKPCNERVAMQ